MQNERAISLLNSIIDYVAVGRNSTDTIIELIKMGFDPEELHADFGFNLHDIDDAMSDEDIAEYVKAD